MGQKKWGRKGDGIRGSIGQVAHQAETGEKKQVALHCSGGGEIRAKKLEIGEKLEKVMIVMRR